MDAKRVLHVQFQTSDLIKMVLFYKFVPLLWHSNAHNTAYHSLWFLIRIVTFQRLFIKPTMQSANKDWSKMKWE